MADLDLSFRAQSLDNQSPDPVEINKHLLGKEDLGERQELAQKISKVSLSGTQVFSKGSHTASLHGEEFLLKTPSGQWDDDGRTAPLLCYGCVPDEPLDSWPGDVVKAVVGFAERIGRTVSPKNQKIAHRGVDAILAAVKKKRRMYVMGTLLAVGGFLIVAIKCTIKMMRFRRHRKKVLWGAGGLMIALTVIWIIYKIFFKE